jgi:hypothetical protein
MPKELVGCGVKIFSGFANLWMKKSCGGSFTIICYGGRVVFPWFNGWGVS